MIVGINYQVEFDEIPELIERLNDEAFDIAQDELVEEIHMATKMLQEENFVKSLEFLARVQEVLVRINMKVSNSTDILKAYTKQLVDPQEPEQDHAQMGAPPDFAEMQEKLAQIKENLKETAVGEQG